MSISSMSWCSGRKLQRLGLLELGETVGAELATVARLLVAAERSERIERATVDVDLAGAHLAGEGDCVVGVGRPDTAGQPVDRVVRDPQGLGLVGVGDDRQ